MRTHCILLKFVQESHSFARGTVGAPRTQLAGTTTAAGLLMISAEHLTVAYDGSLPSELALHRALLMTAGSRVAQVHVVCVVQAEGYFVRLPSGASLPTLLARQWLEHVISRSCRDVPSARQTLVQCHLRSGDPARAIVDLAYRYHTERILLGTGGAESRIGSVAQAVLDLSEIPVDLQTTLGHSGTARRFNPLRFAYAFAGPELDLPAFGTGQRGPAANA